MSRLDDHSGTVLAFLPSTKAGRPCVPRCSSTSDRPATVLRCSHRAQGGALRLHRTQELGETGYGQRQSAQRGEFCNSQQYKRSELITVLPFSFQNRFLSQLLTGRGSSRTKCLWRIKETLMPERGVRQLACLPLLKRAGSSCNHAAISRIKNQHNAR